MCYVGLLQSRIGSPGVRRILELLFYLGPLAFCLAVFWYGLWVGYHEDDWVWLGQHRRVYDFDSLWMALFQPSRHGTFRPISERLTFLLIGRWFGIDAFPFRLLAFATMFANLLLFSRLVRKLTGSALAGFTAPYFWTVNASLAVVMTWCCAYNYLLCGFLLLSAFTLFHRYVESGDRRYYYLQWLPYLAGFLVMEITVVYPVVVLAYVLLCARKYLWTIVPLLAAAAVFFLLHTLYVPKQALGPYAMHLDFSILETFFTYWSWAVVPIKLAVVKPQIAFLVPAWSLLMNVALLGFVVWSARKRNFVPLFFFLCFGLLMGPMLPLRDNIQEYYLALAVMPLGALVACGLASSWQAGGVWRPAGVVLAVLFLASHWPAARFAAKWWYERSMRIENVVRGIAQVRGDEPDKTILLTGVDETIFTGAFRDKAFTAVGIEKVYLDPEASGQLPAELLRAAPSEFALDPAIIRRLLNRNRLVVVSVDKEPFRKITRAYSKQFFNVHPEDEFPRRIETATEAVSDLFGPTWGPAEFGFRWMPRQATFRIGGPKSPEQRIYLSGHNPDDQARNGPLQVRVAVDGQNVGTETLTEAGGFELAFPLPGSSIGRPALEISLEVNRTFRPPGDGRDLGLVFTVFEIR